MKKIITLSLGLLCALGFAQDGAPAAPYYNGFNFNQTGMALKAALADKISTTHTRQLTYGQVWDAIKNTDLDPTDSQYVLLLYGFSANVCPASPSDDSEHRRRLKESNGGGTSCDWNREHAFPQSLGNPELGQIGPGADAQLLRACDVDRNGARANKPYAAGSGNSGPVGNAYWYPGDEWKGDVARILMYMYLRYGDQCLPKVAATGATVASDSNMPAILLQWNAEDPTSRYEDNRNTYLGNANNTYGQGNRNPFIDNPYLATLIWGGPVAQDRWGIAGTVTVNDLQVAVFPNPAVNHEVNVYTSNDIEQIEVVNLNGQLVQKVNKPQAVNHTYTVKDLPTGFYILKITSGNQSTAKKVIVN